MKRTLVISLFIVFLLTSCEQESNLISASTPTPTQTSIPTMTPTLTPTPTYTPTPILTPTPTPIPTPSNLNLEYLHEFETIDPYEFYIEQKGYIQVIDWDVDYKYLDKDKGDNITGDSENGWYVTYNDQTVYYGPGTKVPGGTTFEMRAGKKESDGSVNIVERKKIFISEGAHVTTLYRTYLPGPPRFVYYPAKSSFVLIKRENPEQNYSIHPRHSVHVAVMIRVDDQLLPLHDYEKWPHGCTELSRDNLKNSTVGYTIDGEFFYSGTLPNGVVKCPVLITLEDE